MTIVSSFFQNFLNGNDAITSLFFILGFVFVILWFPWVYRRSAEGSLPMPPGPRGIPLLGSLPFLDPELHTYFTNLAKTYGPIFKLRLGNKTGIVVTSPSLAREILKDFDVVFANRHVSSVAREASYGGCDIVFSPYGSEWRMLKKVCAFKMLSNATLNSFYTLRHHEIRKTIGYMYSRVDSVVNVGEQVFLTTLNVITNMIWGGTIQDDERTGTGAEFQKMVSEITELLGKPNISDFYPSLAECDLQGFVKKMKGLTLKLDGIFDRMIDQRLKIAKEDQKEIGVSTVKEGKDFLQFLLQLKDEKSSKPPLTITHVKAILMDMVLAGTETTSNAIEFAMIELMNNPGVMKKLQNELDELVGKDNVIQESHIHRLPYLCAVIKEALRLHPPLPLIPHCPSETCVIGGYTIPKDAQTFINVWAIHRDPSIWENPLEFIPERFLNGKWDYRGSDFNYFPFGSGRRICVGIAMAERMFMYSLATIVHSFDWKLPEDGKLDLSEKFGIVLKLKKPLLAIPTSRLSDPILYE